MYSNTQKNNFVHRMNLGPAATTGLLLVMISWVTITSGADCQYNFFPCTCSFNEADNDYVITCDNVTMTNVAAAFQSKPALDIKSLSLVIQAEGDSIPADLLDQSRLTSSLTIGGPNGVNPVLRVDPNAFHSSKNSSLGSVTLISLDTSRMDFDFLIDFPSIGYMGFINLMNLERSLPTLPSLPALTTLYFSSCSNMSKAFTDSVLKCDGLKFIQINTGTVPRLTDEGMSALMNWLLPSSANTLENLNFFDHSTSLTRTPTQLGSFKNISYLQIPQNVVNMTISAGSMFSNPGMRVRMYLSKIVSVEEGAFLGNYEGSYIDLQSNFLSRFEAGAFKSVLEQMANSSSGFVFVDSNKFDCYSDPCHLAWLCRDNRNLLSYVLGAKCNGFGESFEQMSPAYFANCPYGN